MHSYQLMRCGWPSCLIECQQEFTYRTLVSSLSRDTGCSSAGLLFNTHLNSARLIRYLVCKLQPKYYVLMLNCFVCTSCDPSDILSGILSTLQLPLGLSFRCWQPSRTQSYHCLELTSRIHLQQNFPSSYGLAFLHPRYHPKSQAC